MKRNFAAILAGAGLLAAMLPPPAWAADDPEPPPAAVDPLGEARGHIAAQRWPQALRALRRANRADDADWNNLMGYALRKSSPPDLAGARRHYDTALRLQPAHRGALEYAGELALMQGDPDRARGYLRRLEAACPGGCEELADLREAIARHTAGRR